MYGIATPLFQTRIEEKIISLSVFEGEAGQIFEPKQCKLKGKNHRRPSVYFDQTWKNVLTSPKLSSTNQAAIHEKPIQNVAAWKDWKKVRQRQKRKQKQNWNKAKEFHLGFFNNLKQEFFSFTSQKGSSRSLYYFSKLLKI